MRCEAALQSRRITTSSPPNWCYAHLRVLGSVNPRSSQLLRLGTGRATGRAAVTNGHIDLCVPKKNRKIEYFN